MGAVVRVCGQFANDEYTLAVLGKPEVAGVEQPPLDEVVQFREATQYGGKVPAVPHAQQRLDVFEDKVPGAMRLERGDDVVKQGPTRVAYPLLLARTTERLTRETCRENVVFWHRVAQGAEVATGNLVLPELAAVDGACFFGKIIRP